MTAAYEVGAERQEKAAANVVAKRYRSEQLRPRSALAFGHCQRRGHDVTAWMGLGHRLEVVSLVGVREHAVGQRSVHSGCSDVSGQHRRLCGPALRSREANRHFPSLEM